MQIIIHIVDNNFQFDTFVTCLRQDADLKKWNKLIVKETKNVSQVNSGRFINMEAGTVIYKYGQSGRSFKWTVRNSLWAMGENGLFGY